MYQQRAIVFELVANPVFHFVSTIVILCNCCLLLTDEYPRDAEWSRYVEMVDLGFVAVYTGAATLATIALQPHPLPPSGFLPHPVFFTIRVRVDIIGHL